MKNRDELWADVLHWVANPDEYDAAKMRRDFDALIDAECAQAATRQQWFDMHAMKVITARLEKGTGQ